MSTDEEHGSHECDMPLCNHNDHHPSYNDLALCDNVLCAVKPYITGITSSRVK